MNKKQRIAAYVVGTCIAIIFFKIPDIKQAMQYSSSWIIVGALLTYLLRDKK